MLCSMFFKRSPWLLVDRRRTRPKAGRPLRNWNSRGDCGHPGEWRWQERWRDMSRFKRNLDAEKSVLVINEF